MDSFNAIGALFSVLYYLLTGFLIVTGFLQCFLGYRLFMTILSMIGLLLGGVVGLVFGVLLALQANDSSALVIVPFAGLLGACLGALIAPALRQLGVFATGFVPGFVVAGLLLGALGVQSMEAGMMMSAVAGMLAGLVALALDKLFIVVGTSFWGAVNLTVGFGLLGGGSLSPGMLFGMPPVGYLVMGGLSALYAAVAAHLFLIAFLTLLGILVQFGLTARIAALPTAQGQKSSGPKLPAPAIPARPAHTYSAGTLTGRPEAPRVDGPDPGLWQTRAREYATRGLGEAASQLQSDARRATEGGIRYGRERAIPYLATLWAGTVLPFLLDLGNRISDRLGVGPATPEASRPLQGTATTHGGGSLPAPVPTTRSAGLMREWSTLAPAPQSAVGTQEWDQMAQPTPAPPDVGVPATTPVSAEEEWEQLEPGAPPSRPW